MEIFTMSRYKHFEIMLTNGQSYNVDLCADRRNLTIGLLYLESSSLTKGYDPVHIPSLHPWYISRQNRSLRGGGAN